MTSLGLDSSFGYVIGVGVAGVIIHNIYMGMGVVSARKKYKVPYPNMYATADICADKTARDAFNCVQRAHQNCLENLPSFYFLLGATGFKHPITSSVLGAIYLVGRILYFTGYSTGNPEARYRGGIGYIGLFGLIGTAIKIAFDFISS